MTSSLPDGYRLRRGRPEDAEPLAEALAAEERALRGQSFWGIEDMEDWWRLLEQRGEQWVVDHGGPPVAVLGIVQRDDLFNSWIGIDPGHFGRGLGSRLLEHAEARTRARGGKALHIDTFGENYLALELFRSSGYRAERRHFHMQIDFDGPPPAPVLPPGFTCTTFDATRDARAFYDAMCEAFVGQWGFRTLPFDEWLQMRVEAPDFDPAIWFVVRDGDEVAGVLRGDAKRWGGGWVAMLGIRPHWQRRGIGSALLATAFETFYERGEPHVGLGVDTQNPTGATRVYERAGMRVVAEMITYVKSFA